MWMPKFLKNYLRKALELDELEGAHGELFGKYIKLKRKHNQLVSTIDTRMKELVPHINDFADELVKKFDRLETAINLVVKAGTESYIETDARLISLATAGDLDHQTMTAMHSDVQQILQVMTLLDKILSAMAAQEQVKLDARKSTTKRRRSR